MGERDAKGRKPPRVIGSALLDAHGRPVIAGGDGRVRATWLRAAAGVTHLAARIATETGGELPCAALLLGAETTAIVVPGRVGAMTCFLEPTSGTQP